MSSRPPFRVPPPSALRPARRFAARFAVMIGLALLVAGTVPAGIVPAAAQLMPPPAVTPLPVTPRLGPFDDLPTMPPPATYEPPVRPAPFVPPPAAPTFRPDFAGPSPLFAPSGPARPVVGRVCAVPASRHQAAIRCAAAPAAVRAPCRCGDRPGRIRVR